ncbi:vWA domain-containing protein [Halodesulfovibrio sp.]|uniref:vWA domain-containing protein n=1 Tax=Halodesulfovibrio sp. TaxID=1912772 RepID=UPI0025E539A2|nr:vWA domain-containing protein [Halodesulfovibrio sp.]MCT4535251.1 VWA domain-containing protein [Halodesulfovibrio sp.]
MHRHTSKKEQGAVSIIGVGLLLTVMLATGFSLDALEIMSTKSRLALAVNNVISTVYSLPESKWLPVATALLNRHFPEDTIAVTASVSKTSNGCALNASASVPSLFMHKFTDAASYTVTERVKLISSTSSSLPKREIALACDVSGSMEDGYYSSFLPSQSEQKFTHLKKAVHALLKEANDDPDFHGRVRVSLIPFADKVNIGRNRAWAKVPTGSSFGECAQSRYPSFTSFNASNTAKQALLPPFTAHIDYYKYVAPSPWLRPICPHAPLTPLTDNFSSLLTQINSLKTFNSNNGSAQDSGIIWAARTLLHSWGGAWGADGNPSASSSTDKYLVLITDGKLSKPVGTNPEDILNDGVGGLCRKIKDAGIKISIIEYHKDSKSNAFKNCASPGHYLTPVPSDPSSAKELTTAVLKSLEKPVVEKNIILTDY